MAKPCLRKAMIPSSASSAVADQPGLAGKHGDQCRQLHHAPGHGPNRMRMRNKNEMCSAVVRIPAALPRQVAIFAVRHKRCPQHPELDDCITASPHISKGELSLSYITAAGNAAAIPNLTIPSSIRIRRRTDRLCRPVQGRPNRLAMKGPTNPTTKVCNLRSRDKAQSPTPSSFLSSR
jgi:hypothetical protein